MKTYLTYRTEDFVQDLYFRKWALGELPPADRFWETWQNTHPEQYEILEKAKSMVIALRIAVPATDPAEVQDAIGRILAETGTERKLFSYRPSLLPIAASVILLLGLAYWFVDRAQHAGAGYTAASSSHQSNPEKQEINDSESARVITLPDSSRVTLESHSSLRISSHFGKRQREVYLTGAAFFDVKRNPEQPFIVYSGKVITKVLGTSFRIKAYESDANVSVGVQTGKVTVFRQAAGEANPMLSEEVLLTPNQQAVFVKKEEKFVKTLVEKPVILSTERVGSRLDFTEAPIPHVLNALEQAYGVQIIFDTERLKDCNLTGSLSEGSLYDKLDIVCETIQAGYKVMDGQVVIDGKGCR